MEEASCTRQRQEWDVTAVHPKVLLGFEKRNEERNRGVLGEGGTKWKVAATSVHDDVLLDSEELSRVRGRLRLCQRWFVGREALRAPEVAKWQQKYRVDWDATDGRNGGARRTVWESLMEMERFMVSSKRRRTSGSSGLGSGLWRRASSGSAFPLCGLGRRIFQCCPNFEILRVLCGWMCGTRAAPFDHHGHLARVNVELLASAYCAAGCVK